MSRRGLRSDPGRPASAQRRRVDRRFPRFVLRHADPKAPALVFGSGRVVLTGFGSPDAIAPAFAAAIVVKNRRIRLMSSSVIRPRKGGVQTLFQEIRRAGGGNAGRVGWGPGASLPDNAREYSRTVCLMV
ncbi:MAG: hypothetical protein ABFC89_09460 [Methanospirillum sp.]